MKEIVFIYGTRPEVIKLAPLIKAVGASFKPFLLSSGQHRELAELASETFSLEADLDLGLMREDQTPNSFLSRVLATCEEVLRSKNISGVIVQGDTTTALGGALAAFHAGIPVAHVEAGLRTGNLKAPFPEEMNRACISRVASIHFAPTDSARDNLYREGIKSNVFVTGNTVVDSVSTVAELLDSGALEPRIAKLPAKLILVTGHRREHFDSGLAILCRAIKIALPEDYQVIFPVHPNPNVKKIVERELGEHPRISLLEPLDYPSLVSLMRQAKLIVTDSGGIQEEAPTFGTPVIVTRESSERKEGIEAGTSKLCPLEDEELLAEMIRESLANKTVAELPNPFGDGKASQRILSHLEQLWG